MRAWNCFGAQVLLNRQTDESAKAPKGAWRKFKPYSNVLWIYYMFYFLLKNYKGSESLDHFVRETEVLYRNLEPDTGRKRGTFTSACDVLEFCEEEGWITSAEALGLPSEGTPEEVDENEAVYNWGDEAVHENNEAVCDDDSESKSTSIFDSEVLFMAPRWRRHSTAA
jgi:hypothetical protein